MINIYEVNETNKMIEQENLDVRTITMGISLLDCADGNLDTVNEKIYKKITTLAKDLVTTGEAISRDFGIPIVNKRISVTPIALVGASSCLLYTSEILSDHAGDYYRRCLGNYSGQRGQWLYVYGRRQFCQHGSQSDDGSGY